MGLQVDLPPETNSETGCGTTRNWADWRDGPEMAKARSKCDEIWVWVNTYRYIFSGMNIHLPAILGFTRYQGFDPSPYEIPKWDMDPPLRILSVVPSGEYHTPQPLV